MLNGNLFEDNEWIKLFQSTKLALDTIQLVFQLKEEMKFYCNYPLVDLCSTKRITNQQIA